MRRNRYTMTLLCLLLACCCKQEANEGSERKDPEVVKRETEVNRLLEKAGAAKTIEAFDYSNWPTLTAGPEKWCRSATIKKQQLTGSKHEGVACSVLSYSFANSTTDPDKEELVYIQRLFGDWRSDLSFCPLGLSLWVKGMPTNKGDIRIVILQDSGMTLPTLSQKNIVETYAYTDLDGFIRKGEWTRMVVPYEWFKPYNDAAKSVRMDLSKMVGWRLEIVNTGREESSLNQVIVDDFEQLTSFREPWNDKAKFSSLFIQVHATTDYKNMDWDATMKAGMDIGIRTWFVPYSVGHGTEDGVAFYSGSKVCETSYDILDKMFAAAEKAGSKIIIGGNCQHYSTSNKKTRGHYQTMMDANLPVVDEVAAKFGGSPAFGGWYIADEFWDGFAEPNWLSDEATASLAWYLEQTAIHMKQKVNAEVSIAPALWRGLPAALCGKWFENLFRQTPDIDNLYIQDCGGRGPEIVTCPEVDFPNWFAEVKKACDKTGVAFGVDIESFMSNSTLGINNRSKTWEELIVQLQISGMFTENITNFSWVTFCPGTPGYDGYKKYYQSLNE